MFSCHVAKPRFWPGPLRNLVSHFTGGHPELEYVDNERPPAFALPALPFASLSSSLPTPDLPLQSLPFARLTPLRGNTSRVGGSSAAAKKTEFYVREPVTGDGRCMFRALVRGMALNKGDDLPSHEEADEADQLRMAVEDVLCRGDERKLKYEEALVAITLDESLNRYCHRIKSPDFWGGEAELLVLSRMCSQPIVVYVPESVATKGSKRATGYVPIQEYGSEFSKGNKERKARQPVRLLYNGVNHYDLLV